MRDQDSGVIVTVASPCCSVIASLVFVSNLVLNLNIVSGSKALAAIQKYSGKILQSGHDQFTVYWETLVLRIDFCLSSSSSIQY